MSQEDNWKTRIFRQMSEGPYLFFRRIFLNVRNKLNRSNNFQPNTDVKYTVYRKSCDKHNSTKELEKLKTELQC